MEPTGADRLAPSLRHFPDANKDADSLDLLIHRLNVQRGHFRTVTEDILEKEIAEGKDDETSEAGDAGPDASKEKDEVEDKKTAEEIYAARAEMFSAIAQAQNEALLALDFISLLLSKDAPIQGQQTMSQLLTQLVPSGTLAYDKWPINEPSSEDKQIEKAVTQGWQMSSVEDSANSLSKAGNRLQKGVEQEQIYWDELLAISDRGYAVARVNPNRNRHIFGAQVGFMDAGPNFKQRGFATLHRNENGHINLDKDLSLSPKSVRVRVVKEGKTVGVSMLPSVSDSVPSIDEIVDRARSSLFEEELFQEMTLETRVLLPYNISLRDNAIHLPLRWGESSEGSDENSCYILLDLVAREGQKLDSDHGPMDSVAQYFAITLRILLCFAYRQKLRRRSRPPPPLSGRDRLSPPPAILRPLVNHCTHMNSTDRLKGFFRQITKVLQSAKVPFETKFSFKGDLLAHNSQLALGACPASSIIDRVVTNLSDPLITVVTITLPSSQLSLASQPLSLTIMTHLSPEAYGNKYDLELPSSVASTHGLEAGTQGGKTFTFQSPDDLYSYLNLVIGIDLVHGLLCSRNPEWTMERGASEATRTTSDGNYEVFTAELNPQRLSVKYSRESAGNVTSQDWTGTPDERSLEDFVSSSVMTGEDNKEAS